MTKENRKNLFYCCLDEEKGGADDGNDGPQDFLPGDSCAEHEMGWPQDEYGGEAHEGLRHTGMGEVDCQQAEADTQEGAQQDGTHCGQGSPAVVPHTGHGV